MQTLLNVLLVIAIVAIAFAVITGRIAGAMDDPTTSIPPRELPDGAVTASDVAGLRFVPAFRGYRMDQVDAALSRLQEELARRDEELATLRPPIVEPEPLEGDAAPVEGDARPVEDESDPVVVAGPVEKSGPDAADVDEEPSVVAEPVDVTEPDTADTGSGADAAAAEKPARTTEAG